MENEIEVVEKNAAFEIPVLLLVHLFALTYMLN
jgi:hypothetical protein